MKSSEGCWKEHKLLLLIVLFGLILRVYSLSLPNLYFDENIQAHASGQFAFKGIQPWTITNFHPPAYTWFTAPATLLFGPGEFSLRLTGAIFGTITILLVYWLAKKWYDKRTALIASALVAATPLHVIYSRLGFGEIGAAALVLASVILMEHILKQNRKGLAWHVSYGFLIGLILLTRYVTLNLLFYYWAFIFAYPLITKNKNLFKKTFRSLAIAGVSSAIFFFGMIYLTGGVERIIYVVHNIMMLILQQSTVYSNPWYFHLITLFDSLSPLMFIALPLGMIYLIYGKKRPRSDVLLVFLVAAFFITLSMQSRRYTRHELVAIPFAVMLVARFLSMISLKIRSKTASAAFMSLFFISGAAWSIYNVERVHDFNVWGEVGNYIDANYPKNTIVHTGFFKHWQVQHYVPREIDGTRKASTLKAGDLVIFTVLSENTTILENSPFEEKSTLWKRNPYKELDYSREFEEYVLKHGKLVKTFEYKGGTAAWLYQMKSAGKPVDVLVEIDPLLTNRFFGIWDFICENWNKDNWVKSMLSKLFSETQENEVANKCKLLKSV